MSRKTRKKGFGSRVVSDTIVGFLQDSKRILNQNAMNPMVDRISKLPVFDGLSRKANLSKRVFAEATGLNPDHDRILLESLLREVAEVLGIPISVEFTDHSVLLSIQ
jgi:hypothetical protein